VKSLYLLWLSVGFIKVEATILEIMCFSNNIKNLYYEKSFTSILGLNYSSTIGKKSINAYRSGSL
jgi:hypothetical protein